MDVLLSPWRLLRRCPQHHHRLLSPPDHKECSGLYRNRAPLTGLLSMARWVQLSTQLTPARLIHRWLLQKTRHCIPSPYWKCDLFLVVCLRGWRVFISLNLVSTPTKDTLTVTHIPCRKPAPSMVLLCVDVWESLGMEGYKCVAWLGKRQGDRERES